jgi:hypothetical protein
MEAELYPPIFVGLRWKYISRFYFRLAEQQLLGQRRTFVRRMRFGADERQTPVESLLPKRFGRPSASLATPDDNE